MQRITGTIGRIRINEGAEGAFTVGESDDASLTNTGTATGRLISFDSGNSPGARVLDDRTRAKGINQVAFMKIKDVG
jgi:hypothetical protein